MCYRHGSSVLGGRNQVVSDPGLCRLERLSLYRDCLGVEEYIALCTSLSSRPRFFRTCPEVLKHAEYNERYASAQYKRCLLCGDANQTPQSKLHLTCLQSATVLRILQHNTLFSIEIVF